MPCPFHPPWLDHSNYTWRGVQVTSTILIFTTLKFSNLTYLTWFQSNHSPSAFGVLH
jgi:hypothetical protein